MGGIGENSLSIATDLLSDTATEIRSIYFFMLGFGVSEADSETTPPVWNGASPKWTAQELEELGAEWRKPDPFADLDLQNYAAPLLSRLLSSVPRALIELRPNARDDDRLARLRPPALPTVDGLEVELEAFRLSLWSVGAGLVTLAVRVTTSSARNVREAVRQHARDAEPIVEQVVRTLLPPKLAGGGVSVLWSNANFEVAVANPTDANLRALAILFAPDGVDCELPGPNTRVRIGISSCVVMTRHEPSGKQAAAALMRLIGVQQVCWVAAVAYDARLTDGLASVVAEGEDATTAVMDGRAQEILGLYNDVRAFRTSYESVVAHLEPMDAAVWKVIDRAWRVSDLSRVLDDKLQFLQTSFEHLSDRIEARRSGRLNELVLIFTFLSIFGILVAALAYVLATPSLIPEWVALTVLGVLLVADVVAYAIYRGRI